MSTVGGNTLQNYPTSPNAKTRADMSKEVFSEAEHFREVNFNAEAIARQKQSELNDLNEEIGQLEIAIGAYERGLILAGFPVREVNGKKVRVDWRSEQFPTYAEKIARRKKVQAIVVPGSPWPRIEQWLRRNSGRNYRRIIKKYFVGDKRPPSAIRDACIAARKLIEATIVSITEALAHSSDAKSRVDRDIERVVARGKPDLSGIFRGYTIKQNGMIETDTNPEIYWPQDTLVTSEGDFVPAVHVLSLLAWLDPDRLKRRLYDLIDEAADDENAVTEADKPAILAKLNAELLEAQRAEEAAYRLCEAENQFVRRPANWPVEVMLQIELDTTPVAKPAPVEFVKETADAEFEGADA